MKCYRTQPQASSNVRHTHARTYHEAVFAQIHDDDLWGAALLLNTLKCMCVCFRSTGACWSQGGGGFLPPPTIPPKWAPQLTAARIQVRTRLLGLFCCLFVSASGRCILKFLLLLLDWQQMTKKQQFLFVLICLYSEGGIHIVKWDSSLFQLFLDFFRICFSVARSPW